MISLSLDVFCIKWDRDAEVFRAPCGGSRALQRLLSLRRPREQVDKVFRLAANRCVLVAYTTDERPASLRLRVLSLPSLLMGGVVESNGGALVDEVVPLRSGYIDVDELNHCVWTVGPERISCFEMDTLRVRFRVLQRDEAPLLRHALGLLALVWASPEHMAMVVYSAAGTQHFHSEVRMQNLVTVVEILTKDVFLCQSQGEDAQLLDVAKGRQLCTLPNTEHWQLPNIAVLIHLGVILVTLPGTLQIWRYATWDSGASCWPVKEIDFQGSFSQRTLVDRARASLVLPQAPSASGRGDDLFLIDLRCCKRPERFQRGVCFDGGGLAFIQGDLSEGWLLVCGRQGGVTCYQG